MMTEIVRGGTGVAEQASSFDAKLRLATATNTRPRHCHT